MLRLSGALGHDPCAALLVDGEIVAAAEEERFVRDKHTRNRMPLEAARYCLAEAGIPAQHVDAAALDIFADSDLRYLVVEDFLVGKPASDA